MQSKTEQVGSIIKRYLLITVAAVSYAVGIGVFLDPNDLVPGGVSGIAIILNRMIGLETGTLILLINIPILLLGLWKFGAKFLTSTIYAVILTTIFINEGEKIAVIRLDPMLAAVTGGVFCGAGMALIFRQNATTGGIDIIIKLLRGRFPHLRTGTLFLMLDVVIIVLAGVFFGKTESALYAAIAVFVTARAMNVLLYGSDEARLFYIISDYTRDIADRLMKELDIGVTFLDGRGAYYNTEKEVILCACPKKVAPKVLNCVREMDRNAFMLACSANEIYGEGYKSYDSTQL